HLYLHGPHPKSLPSETEFYDKFSVPSRGKCSCKNIWLGDVESALDGKLDGYGGFRNSGSMFMDAYCCAYKMKKDDSSHKDTPCYFFYYWLGDKFFMDKDNTNLEAFIAIIYKTLENAYPQYKCQIKYQNVDKFVFGLRKEVYDFFHNCDTIRDRTQDDRTKCSPAYSEYVDRITATYDAVDALCRRSPNDEYCNSFWTENKTSILDKLSNLKCESQTTDEKSATCSPTKTESANTHPSNLPSTTTTALSSIFGTLGATALPFLLYKYKPWSSWFGNHSSGYEGSSSRIKKRSNRQQQFDEITETSTMDFTGSSETSSTFDPTTVHSTAAYNTRQPSRGERRARAGTGTNNNTSDRQNISYQNIERILAYNNSPILDELDPNNLSSKKEFYDKFNSANGNDCNGSNNYPQQLEAKLQSDFSGCTQITADAKKIAHAYCSACEKKKTKTWGDKPCHFFYYWLGDKYGKNLNNNHKFSDLLSEIYHTIGTFSTENKCEVKYDDVFEKLLPQMKKVYDYYYENEKINDILLKNTPICDDKWLGYLSEVSLACEAIRPDCAERGKDSNSYCKDFNDTYKVPCALAEALNLYCTEATTLKGDTTYSSVRKKLEAQRKLAQKATEEAEEAKQTVQSQLNETVLQANKASTLSSAFGTLAALELPALLFLAYKYKPWSSWFGIHTSGNGGSRRSNRRRRSAGRDIDGLTEISTIGSTTEDASTVYGVKSVRKGRTNTPGRQIIGYQNMRRTRFAFLYNGLNFDNLPSKVTFYDEFENGNVENCTGECQAEVGKYELTSRGFSTYEDRIKKALGYIYKIYGTGKEPSKSEAYHFLYYWLGDLLSKSTTSSGDSGGPVTMICNTINKYCTKQDDGHGCGIPCSGEFRKDLFSNKKALFDFWYDYGALLTLLESSRFPNVEKCDTYYQNVKAAKDAMETHCNPEGNDDYCKNFWKHHKTDIEQKLSKLHSELSTARTRIKQEAQAALSKAEQDLNKATTTSTISSIFGTLATIGAPYLLYKYKPWSSWFGNHSSGSGRSTRKKRSNVERNLDDLRETSTLGYTDSSETSSTMFRKYSNLTDNICILSSASEQFEDRRDTSSDGMTITESGNRHNRRHTTETISHLRHINSIPSTGVENFKASEPGVRVYISQYLQTHYILAVFPPHLLNLPSKTDFYNKFDVPGKVECKCKDIWPDQWGKDLQRKLNRNLEIVGTDEMVLDAYCCAHKLKKEQSQSSGDPCLFFYYWMEDKFHSHTDNRKLRDFMREIYETLKVAPYNHECKVIYQCNIDKSLFGYIKEVYDFSYNYSTIETNAEHYRSAHLTEYSRYLGKIRTACLVARAQCKENENDPYCTWFNEKEGKEEYYCNRKKLLELENGKPNPNPNQAGSSGSFSDEDEVCKLENLPSKLGYSRFDGGVASSMESEIWNKEGEIENKLKPVLTKYGNMQQHIDNIAKAWCYLVNIAVEGAAGKKEVKGPVYYLFYYWLGDKVWSSDRNGTPFPDVMTEIYFPLQTVFHGIDRGPICTEDIDQIKFNQMKKVFDYYYDHGTIKDCIHKSQISGLNCAQVYSDYLQEAADVYGKMKQYCEQPGSSRKICCKHFNEISNQIDGSNIPEPSELKYKLELLQQTIVSEAETISPTSTPTGPIVSSTLGTLIGLPIIVYLLYKNALCMQQNVLQNHSLLDLLLQIFQFLLKLFLMHIPEFSTFNFPGKVPSNTDFYNKFWTASKDHCGCKDIWPEKWGSDLKGKLREGDWLKSSKEMIMNAYCCAHKLKGKEQFDDAPCHFFYYWVGENFLKSTGNRDLGDFMKEIYETLKKAPYNHKCKIEYDADVNWDLFKQMKEVYDFFYDYSTIRSNAHQYDTKDGSEYSKYLRRISGACIVAKAQCPYKGDHPYCAWYNEKKEDYCGKELSELRTKPKPNPDSNQECNWEELPSEERYKKFDEPEKYTVEDTPQCKKETAENYLSNALSNYGSIKDHISNIAKAWCYVAGGAEEKKGGKERELKNDLYYLFYYWVGDKVWNTESTKTSFPKVMDAIYQKLWAVLSGISCGLIEKDIDESTFGNMRKVFDYSLNYTTIRGCVQTSPPPGSKYIEECAKYVEEVAEAYSAMEQYCAQHVQPRKTCCRHFEEMFKENGDSTIRKPSELKSELDSLQKTTLTQAEIISSTTTSNTPAVASSTIALIGIPALAFYLYKHNRLPSWIHGFLGNNNSRNGRKRRTAMGRNSGTRMENFTEYSTEGSSTIGPTGYSTTNSTSNLSTDSSTIYDRLHRRGGTNNNARGHARNVVFPIVLEYIIESKLGSTEDCDDDCTKNMKNTVLNDGSSIKHYKGEVVHASCYVSKKYTSGGTHKNEWCHFLYYWIGYKLYHHTTPGQIKSPLNYICKLITQTYGNKGCTLICPDNIDQTIFGQMKEVFDYSYDYKTVRGELLKDGSHCEGEWSSYRDKIFSACDAISKHCQNSTYAGDPYCKKFKDKYDQYCDTVKLSKEKCKLQSQLTSVQEEKARAEQAQKLALSEKQAISTKLNNAIHQANKASSLSSAFGTLAALELPALLFLAYKYKPWSSWFGNNFSGNGRSGRNKRSNIQRNFDNLTETSTVDFTGSSETSSTIDDHSTVRPSAYIGQPGGRTNNNAGGLGMVGYQNM
ncbi:KIR protein, partial [Plasmodium coatneyi]